MRRRRFKNQKPVRRVSDQLDRTKGTRGGSYERRREDKWTGYQTLSLKRHGELFKSLVSLDFDYLLSQNFAATPRVLADLLPQSVLGRAQNGHGWFCDDYGTALRFPDATFDRVLSVLEADDANLKGHLVRQRRGEMLHQFGDWILSNLHSKELELVLDGHPVFGIDFLANRKVNTRDFLTGLVLAGFMDDWSYRKISMQQHKRSFNGMPYLIGGGDILIVDREKFEMCGLGDTGATVFLDDQILELKDVGIICRDQHQQYSYPDYDQAYFRRQRGDGVCDDMAMIYVGAKFGFDAMLGAFVMDAIDTYDKYLLNLTWGGYDTHLAREIQQTFLHEEDQPLICDSEILSLIHFASKRNSPPVNLSSSHRRLIQVEKNSAVPTLLNHWRFIQGKSVYNIKLGYARVPAESFYRVAFDRLKAIGITVEKPGFIKGRWHPNDSLDADSGE